MRHNDGPSLGYVTRSIINSAATWDRPASYLYYWLILSACPAVIGW
jgi:hypothetical protein